LDCDETFGFKIGTLEWSSFINMNIKYIFIF
jgi:hypothetical protein